MSFDPILGIDLGTSNSCIAVVDPATGQAHVIQDEQQNRVIPSVVSFHPNGSVLVGAQAKARRVIDPKNTLMSVKRFIGRPFTSEEVKAAKERSNYEILQGENDQPMVKTRAGSFAAAEISAIVLDHLAQLAQTTIGAQVSQVVVTVPANFNDAQRQATATAGAIADLVVVRILNEPTAAALAYGHGRSMNQTVAVYDFGGGTFDITLLELRDNVFEVISTAGDTFLGGDDIDAMIVDEMVMSFLKENRVDLRVDETAIHRLRGVAEQTKIQLSNKGRAVVKMEEIAIGEGGKSLDLHFAIERQQYENRIASTIDRSFRICDEALRLAGISATQIDEIILVGGTTKIPYLREKVAQYFGRAARMDINPDEAVAIGAALQGAAMARLLQRPTPRATMVGVGQVMPVKPSGGLPPAAPGTVSGFSPSRLPGSINVPAPRTGGLTAQLVDPARPGAPDLPRVSDEPEMMSDDLLEMDPDQDAQQSAPADVGDNALGRIATKKVAVTPQASAVAEVNRFAGREEETHAPPPPAPVLLDVTPRALGVATVGGYCDELIPRNAMVPVEHKRVFSPAHDNQSSVQLRICQGESRRFDENTELGVLVLHDIAPRHRQDVKIAVTFEINTDGILIVSALDETTGKTQSAHIKLTGAQSQDEIDAAKARIKGLRGSA